MTFAALAFDADDTLWENEVHYRLTQEAFADLLRDHADPDRLAERLLAAERRNLSRYGYGIKGFTLSMIETALEVTGRRAPAEVIARILEIGRDLLDHPVALAPQARETLETLGRDFPLLLVTKGDLFDQERKIAASGLADLFEAIEIVSEKTEDTYRRVFDRHGDGPTRGLMVGNSLRSDIRPALAAGAFAVWTPHPLTWTHEHAEEPADHVRYARIERLADLPALIDALSGAGAS